MPDLTLAAAKEIVSKGLEHGVMRWDDPDSVDDARVMDAAKLLVDQARQAEANGSVNEVVLEILFASQIEPTSEPTREAYARRFKVDLPSTNGSGSDAQPSAVEPEPVVPQPGAPTAEEVNAIFGGVVYDDLKVAQIKSAVLDAAAAGDLSPEEWEQIKAYESAHEERKTVLSLQPTFKKPAPEPTVASTGGAFGAFSSPTTTYAGGPVSFAVGGGGAPPPSGAESLEAVYNGEATSRAQQEGLPIPPQLNVEGALTVPIDITNVSDQDLSRISTQFYSLFARAQWLISQEEGRERAAELLEREAHRDAYVSGFERHKSEIPEDKRGPTAIDNARRLAERDADGAARVLDWQSRRARHGVEVRELKALSVGYDKACWRITEELNRRARLATTRPS